MKPEMAKKIMEEAEAAGIAALEKCVPEPMGVTDGVQSWVIPDGECGFAWVTVQCKGMGLQFVNALKRLGMASADINCFDPGVVWKKGVYRGYQYWVHHGNQSVAKKEAYAEAFGAVLRTHNIPCTSGSRLD